MLCFGLQAIFVMPIIAIASLILYKLSVPPQSTLRWLFGLLAVMVIRFLWLGELFLLAWLIRFILGKFPILYECQNGFFELPSRGADITLVIRWEQIVAVSQGKPQKKNFWSEYWITHENGYLMQIPQQLWERVTQQFVQHHPDHKHVTETRKSKDGDAWIVSTLSVMNDANLQGINERNWLGNGLCW